MSRTTGELEADGVRRGSAVRMPPGQREQERCAQPIHVAPPPRLPTQLLRRGVPWCALSHPSTHSGARPALGGAVRVACHGAENRGANGCGKVVREAKVGEPHAHSVPAAAFRYLFACVRGAFGVTTAWACGGSAAALRVGVTSSWELHEDVGGLHVEVEVPRPAVYTVQSTAQHEPQSDGVDRQEARALR